MNNQEIKELLESQKKYFQSGATLSVDFRVDNGVEKSILLIPSELLVSFPPILPFGM